MNKTKLLGAMLLMMGVTGSALAQNGFYAGASIGQSTIDGCSGLTNCDDEDTAWKIFGGWEMNKNIAFEAAWVDIGKIRGSIGGSAVSAKIDGWTLAAKGTLPLNDQFSVYGKLGMISWDAKGGGAASGIDDDGTDLMYAIGAQYMFNDKFGIFGEWEWYDIDDDVDLLSIGALIKF